VDGSKVEIVEVGIGFNVGRVEFNVFGIGGDKLGDG